MFDKITNIESLMSSLDISKIPIESSITSLNNNLNQLVAFINECYLNINEDYQIQLSTLLELQQYYHVDLIEIYRTLKLLENLKTYSINFMKSFGHKQTILMDFFYDNSLNNNYLLDENIVLQVQGNNVQILLQNRMIVNINPGQISYTQTLTQNDSKFSPSSLTSSIANFFTTSQKSKVFTFCLLYNQGDEIKLSSTASLDASGATGGGNISSDGGGLVTARGVVWGTSTLPTISLSTRTNDGGGTGAFTSSMTGLSTNTKYYVRAYATNSAGTSYGDEVTFTTLNNLPILVTNDATSITATTAVLNGNVTGDGGSAVTQKGIVWAMTTGPNLSSNLGNLTLGGGLGTIAVGPTGLTPGATYYVKAYATNSNGTAYGNEVTFKTLATNPSILTYTPSNVTGSTALASAKIIKKCKEIKFKCKLVLIFLY
jgi:hypothetical protein